MSDQRDAPHAALSRELALTCDAAGRIRWADARAAGRLGAAPGRSLVDFAAPGAEEKVRGFLGQAARGRVEGWELALIVDGAPATLAFSAAPRGEELDVVGSLVPEDYAAVLARTAETMSELATLHRETARQQRELQRRQEEVRRLHAELDDSDKGVAALHLEIDEKQDTLRRVNEVKSRVVANVSHEFRTPLHSILGLSRLLLARTDGELTPEQEKQVGFIRQSAESLSELVNDLLDLSKMEAGKTGLRVGEFTPAGTFSALRGMFRTLVPAGVSLVFDEPEANLVLETDEGKVSQVLRNFISNALKFTERGEVRVLARAGADGEVVFTVRDTGIGIAPEDRYRVFHEFVQIDSAAQRKAKGTGLGLSLCARLAELLGGTLDLESEEGRGSTFSLTIPRLHPEAREMVEMMDRGKVLDPARAPILVVEDDRQTLFLYEKYLAGSGFQILPARSIEDARRQLERVRPAAVVLDVMLEGETSWSFLSDLKSREETRDIPTLVVTITDREEKARALGADEFYVKPLERDWLLKRLKAISHSHHRPVDKILVIDDDEVARYLVARLLQGTHYVVIEAANGSDGVRLAREHRPQVIFLDFMLGSLTAFDVIDELKLDPRTRDIPVIVHTSKDLAEEERRKLAQDTASIVQKQSLSREVAITRIRDALVKAGLGGREPLGPRDV